MRFLHFLHKCLLLLLAVAGFGGGIYAGDSPSTQNYQIVTGTSAIYSAVKEFVDESHITGIVVPPNLCPGHFDLKPSDIEKFAKGNLIILHEWQRDLPAIKSLLKATSQHSDKRILWIPLQGSWMVPENYLKGLKTIGEMLVKENIISNDLYRNTLEKREKEILEFSNKAKEKLKSLEVGKINVISSNFQSQFLKWLGFNVIAEYPRAEEITIKLWGELLKLGQEKNVRLVVENLQSGEIQTVKSLAREIDAKSVVLSNFPLAYPEERSWEDSVLHNIEIIINALCT